MERPEDIDAYTPKLLTESPGDYVYATGIGLLSLALSAVVPGGGIAAALFGVKQLSPMWKRLDKWMVKVQEAIDKLEKEGITIEELANNEQFITALLQASQTALRTHQHEKLIALRNALLNVALGSQPDDNKQLIFLALIDELTEDHIRVLYFLDNSEDYLRQKGISTEGNGLAERLFHAFPELRDREPYVAMLVATLYGRGLLVGDWPHAADIREMANTTDSAKEFLAFIMSPPERE